MKRVCAAMLAMLLMLVIPGYAEAASQQELASDFEILYTDKQLIEIKTNKSSNFYRKSVYSNNDVVVLLTAEHPFKGKMSIKTKGKKRGTVSFSANEFINAGNHYALTVVCTLPNGSLMTGDKVTVNIKNKEGKGIVVAVVAMQKSDALLNRSVKGKAVIDNDFLTYYGGE